jgi:hypothetical protein
MCTKLSSLTSESREYNSEGLQSCPSETVWSILFGTSYAGMMLGSFSQREKVRMRGRNKECPSFDPLTLALSRREREFSKLTSIPPKFVPNTIDGLAQEGGVFLPEGRIELFLLIYVVHHDS